MTDLNATLAELATEYDRLSANPDLEAINELDAKVKLIFSSTAGDSELESRARDLMKKIALGRQATNPIDRDELNLKALLRRARYRIESGAASDLPEAIELLQQVLRASPDDETAYELTLTVADRAPYLKDSIDDFLQTIPSPVTASLRRQLHKNRSSSQQEPEENRLGQQVEGSPSESSSVWEAQMPPPREVLRNWQDQVVDSYHQGEYAFALNLGNEILHWDPTNNEIRRYCEKSTLGLKLGLIPDRKIPLEARVALNRGISAEHAGYLDQAETLYTRAKTLARDANITRWGAAESALKGIRDKKTAKELSDRGDRSYAEDSWDEALQWYKAAVEVLNDERTNRKLKLLTELIGQQDQFNSLTGKLAEQPLTTAQTLLRMRQTLAETETVFPSGQSKDGHKLESMQNEVDALIRDITPQLVDQARSTIEEARGTHRIQKHYQQILVASDYLEAASALGHTLEELRLLITEVQWDLSRMDTARRHLLDARKVFLSPEGGLDRSKLAQAAEHLIAAREFLCDPDFRSLLEDLLNASTGECRRNVEFGKLADANEWYSLADHLFNCVLGNDPSTKEQDRVELIRISYKQKLSELRADLLFRRATVLAQEGDTQEAVSLFEELLSSPASERFQPYYQRVVKRHEQSTQVKERVARGVAALQARAFQEAAEALAQALALNPDDGEVKSLYQEALISAKRQEKGWSVLSGRERAEVILLTVGVCLLLAGAIYLLARLI